MYLSNPDFMYEVHQRILKQMHDDEDCIVVAHSLGSVIAFHLLSDPAYHFSVQRFVTLASPLSFRVIQSKLPIPIERPKCLNGDWYNFYSKDDFLTAFPL
ncbi:alpha/beta hydrolase fold family protein, partial [Acinetobacter baumannii 6112]